jgi:hypothetical protein
MLRHGRGVAKKSGLFSRKSKLFPPKKTFYYQGQWVFTCSKESSSYDAPVSLFTLTKANQIQKFAPPSSDKSVCIQASPNGRLLATTTLDGGAIVFDEVGKQVCTIPPNSTGESTKFLAWGYGDRYLLLYGGSDRKDLVFEIPSGRLIGSGSEQVRISQLNPATSGILLKSKSTFLTADIRLAIASDQESILVSGTRLAKMSSTISSVHSISSDGIWILGQSHGFDSFHVFHWNDGALLASARYPGSMGHLGFAGTNLVHYHIADENVVGVSEFLHGDIGLHHVIKIGDKDSYNVSDIVCNHADHMLILFEPIENDNDEWFYAEFDISALLVGDLSPLELG